MVPKSNYIFLTPVERNTSPLLIPEHYRYRSTDFLNGKVVAIGPKVHQVRIGDEVAYNKNQGVEVEVDSQKYIVIKPDFIFAVV